MLFQRKKGFFRKNFSLIELLIVIGIMGALAALILPSFSDSETAAKDTACDYNQAGTLRYLQMFRSANGVYPTGFHTGMQDDAGNNTLRLASDDTKTALTTCAEYNFTKGSTVTPLTDKMIESLEGAGIVSLAYGRNIAERITTSDSVYVVNSTDTSGTYWTEELDAMTGAVKEDGAPLQCRSANLYDIAAIGQADDKITPVDNQKIAAALRAHTANSDGSITFTEPKFKIVPMYVAPTMDWENYYSDGPNPSKVSIAMTGKCPWGEGGQARYYIAFFKVYDDGTPAKLLCTSCPDCGILDGDAF